MSQKNLAHLIVPLKFLGLHNTPDVPAPGNALPDMPLPAKRVAHKIVGEVRTKQSNQEAAVTEP